MPPFSKATEKKKKNPKAAVNGHLQFTETISLPPLCMCPHKYTHTCFFSSYILFHLALSYYLYFHPLALLLQNQEGFQISKVSLFPVLPLFVHILAVKFLYFNHSLQNVSVEGLLAVAEELADHLAAQALPLQQEVCDAYGCIRNETS